MKFDSVIVRFGGEIGIKGEWTRRAYERLLSKNIKKVLKHYGIDYEELIRKRGRIYIRTESFQEVAGRMTQIFGVSSISPAIQTNSDINVIVRDAVELARILLKNGSSFAVRCRRVGQHSYSSVDVCRATGKQILADLDSRRLKVDLRNPKVIISIEVRGKEAYIFTETLYGVDGFPVGAQPNAVCLLSGGIDSAVACWLVMKRGCPIIPVHFDNSPFTDKSTTEKALDVARKLFEWSIDFPRKVYIVPHGKNLEILVKESSRKITCILCKRMMYRIAERIAEIEKAEGIVTGEAIGEQASQTLHNLRVLNEVSSKYPIHRPLLGFNKLETEELAKKIGTFEISTRKAKGCGATPRMPATKAKLKIVRKAEQELNIEDMIARSIKEAKIVEVST